MEELQEHPDESVYEKAVSLLEVYFGAEEVDDGENIAPETADASNLYLEIAHHHAILVLVV